MTDNGWFYTCILMAGDALSDDWFMFCYWMLVVDDQWLAIYDWWLTFCVMNDGCWLLRDNGRLIVDGLWLMTLDEWLMADISMTWWLTIEDVWLLIDDRCLMFCFIKWLTMLVMRIYDWWLMIFDRWLIVDDWLMMIDDSWFVRLWFLLNGWWFRIMIDDCWVCIVQWWFMIDDC